MNIKRAAGLGFLLYIASFILGMLSLVVLQVDLTNVEIAPVEVWYVGFALTIILTAAFSLWYFNKEKSSTKKGFQLGIAFFVVASIIELVIIIPTIIFTNAAQSVTAYYTSPLFWITIGIIVGTSTVVGWWKGKK